MSKVIICDGDSWTGGYEINPDLEGIDGMFVNHPDNDEYRLPKLWPDKLGKKLKDVEIHNIAHAGSSNDGIVRRVIRKVMGMLLERRAKDLYVIIGWTSPERKDFFYKNGRTRHWETMYPAQLQQDFNGDKDLKKFYNIYLEKFWNEEEFLDRYIQQNLFLHYFLKEHKIKHLFFDAFYEANTDSSSGIVNSLSVDDIIQNSHQYDKIEHYALTTEYHKVRQDIVFPISFRNYLLKQEDRRIKQTLFDKYHPSEDGQELWTKQMLSRIKRDIYG